MEPNGLKMKMVLGGTENQEHLIGTNGLTNDKLDID
jgi:hypothetical protein